MHPTCSAVLYPRLARLLRAILWRALVACIIAWTRRAWPTTEARHLWLPGDSYKRLISHIFGLSHTLYGSQADQCTFLIVTEAFESDFRIPCRLLLQ